MLIQTNRHTKEDIVLWNELEESDLIRYFLPRMKKFVNTSISVIDQFNSKVSGYCGVSWGKDSLVVADMIASHGFDIPLVWIKVVPIFNPDCILVRDIFLKKYPNVCYDEIEVACDHDRHGYHATGTLEKGFSIVVKKYGKSYVSGVRANESSLRMMSAKKFGFNSINSCRPLLNWKAEDVYAYLAGNEISVHPAYGMLGNGRYDRNHIRVASLGGKRGDGYGRVQWEIEYYGDALRRLEK